jgi:tungstate transport system permease protein
MRRWLAIVLLSLRVSLSALVIGAVSGLPPGAPLAVARFPGRPASIVVLNALMGLPPVVARLIIYLMLSRCGSFGALGLPFTPTAMIIAQAVLITPIIAALARQVLEGLWDAYAEQFRSVGAGPLRALPTLLWDGCFALITVLLAGFGRASAEVGAVMIVCGNSDGFTRVMTTAIALETSGGEQQRLALARAAALGPEMLLIDEPCASLDPAATRAAEEIVTIPVARGTKIVIARHDVF